MLWRGLYGRTCRRLMCAGRARMTGLCCAPQIRWFSFQFIMQQLADELEEMHRAEAIVLKMLPNALKARHA